MYVTEFTVTGDGYFPIDMLRYDQCFPVTQHDVELIRLRHHGTVEIRLAQHHATEQNRITNDRWESFGWFTLDIRSSKKIS